MYTVPHSTFFTLETVMSWCLTFAVVTVPGHRRQCEGPRRRGKPRGGQGGRGETPQGWGQGGTEEDKGRGTVRSTRATHRGQGGRPGASAAGPLLWKQHQKGMPGKDENQLHTCLIIKLEGNDNLNFASTDYVSSSSALHPTPQKVKHC